MTKLIAAAWLALAPAAAAQPADSTEKLGGGAKRLRGRVYWVATMDRTVIGEPDKVLPAWFIDASDGRLLKTGTR